MICFGFSSIVTILSLYFDVTGQKSWYVSLGTNPSTNLHHIIGMQLINII